MRILDFAAIDRIYCWARRLGAEGDAEMAICAVFLRRAAIAHNLHAAMPGSELAAGREHWQSVLDQACDADVGLVASVIEFLARKSRSAWARKQDLLKLARDVVEPAAIHGLADFFRAETISLAFSSCSHSNDLLNALKASLWWWGDDWNPETSQFFGESHGRDVEQAAGVYGPPPTRAVIQSTHLVHDVISYCFDYPVIRQSKETSRNGPDDYASTDTVRTRDNEVGEQFCKFCPEPSERFEFVHRHAASCDALGTPLLACIRNSKGLNTDEYTLYSNDFCVSHSIIGPERAKKNRGRREGDRKLQEAYKLQFSSCPKTLVALGLYVPRSGFLRRKIAWLRVKPSTKRLLARSQDGIRRERVQAQNLVNRTFGQFPGFDPLVLTISDSIVEIEALRSGRFSMVSYEGAVRLFEDTGDGWKHWDQAFRDAQETLRHLIHNEFCWRKHPAPSAFFQTLGLEVFVDSESIRFVFESPDLLDAARAPVPSEAAGAQNTAP